MNVLQGPYFYEVVLLVLGAVLFVVLLALVGSSALPLKDLNGLPA